MAFNEPPLLEACRTGNVSAVPAYLTNYNWADGADRGMLAECLTSVCNSPYGSPAEKVQIATMLMNKGTDADLLGRALNATCWHGREELASVLLDRGANPNYLLSGLPLVIVCRQDDPRAFVRTLLRHGADPRLKDSGTTPLHLTSCFVDRPGGVRVSIDIMRVLLEHGAGSTIYRKDDCGRTVLDYAQHPRMKALLRKYFILVVRKYVIGGNAEHPSRNRMRHLAPQIASLLI